jgi:hypothetical protein
VVYEYVWSVDETPKQTSTYTTTYFTYPGTHTAYALIANTALPPPRDIEVVGIPYRIVPGETSTQHVSATVATHSPIAPTWKTNHASITSTTLICSSHHGPKVTSSRGRSCGCALTSHILLHVSPDRSCMPFLWGLSLVPLPKTHSQPKQQASRSARHIRDF